MIQRITELLPIAFWRMSLIGYSCKKPFQWYYSDHEVNLEENLRRICSSFVTVCILFRTGIDSVTRGCRKPSKAIDLATQMNFAFATEAVSTALIDSLITEKRRSFTEFSYRFSLNRLTPSLACRILRINGS